MPKIQQEVMIYKNKTFSIAQNQFEKDLRQRQGQGWRLISITPTRQGFLTAIYERDSVADNTVTPDNQYLVKIPEETVQPQYDTNPVSPNPASSDEETLLSQKTPRPYEPVPQPISGTPYELVAPPNPLEPVPQPISSTPYESSPYELTPPPVSSDLYASNPYGQVPPTMLASPYASNPYDLIAPPPPPAVPAYSKAIFLGLIVALVLSFAFIGSVGEGTGYVSTLFFRIGMSVFVGASVSLFIIDWKGFFSLDGLLKWRQMSAQKRVGMGCLFYCFFPVFSIIYLVRAGLRVFQFPGPVFSKRWDAPAPIKQREKIGVITGAIIVFPLLLCSIFAPVVDTSASNVPANITVTPAHTAVIASSTSAPTATPAPTQKPSPTAKPTPTAKLTPTPIPYATFSDGTFVVGKDIQPGTYRTRESSPGCYFERLSGFGGTLDDIIANDDTDDPAIVTISRNDKGFHSDNCGTWTKDLSAITVSKTSFSDGMYIVGTDIKPGTYKSSGQSNCYYARLSGFGGTLDDIITNNNTDNSAIVTISAGDKGFQSHNCGAWKRM